MVLVTNLIVQLYYLATLNSQVFPFVLSLRKAQKCFASEANSRHLQQHLYIRAFLVVILLYVFRGSKGKANKQAVYAP